MRWAAGYSGSRQKPQENMESPSKRSAGHAISAASGGGSGTFSGSGPSMSQRGSSGLMAALVESARAGRHTRMVGTVLTENHRMLEFVRSLGFRVESSSDDPQLMEVSLEL